MDHASHHPRGRELFHSGRREKMEAQKTSVPGNRAGVRHKEGRGRIALSKRRKKLEARVKKNRLLFHENKRRGGNQKGKVEANYALGRQKKKSITEERRKRRPPPKKSRYTSLTKEESGRQQIRFPPTR